ncbi:MAG: YfcC family protein [Oscillospiraceae bacterium]
MKKKSFKMPNAFVTLFLIIAVVAALTWIVPAGQYEYVDPDASRLEPIAGTYSQAEQNPQGVWEVIMAPVTGFYEAADIMLFLLIIGGFLGIVMHTGAIDAGIGAVVKKLNGKDHIMIPILMIIFGLGGTIFGMGEETVAFYLLIIPVFIAAGYDALCGMATIFLGTGIGYMASTTNPFSTGIASGFAGISVGDGMGTRVLLFVLLETAGIIYIMRYAKKVKADPTKSLIYDMKQANEEYFKTTNGATVVEFTKQRKIILSIFAISFLIMVIGVIPWASKFNIMIFENANNFILGLPVIGKILGHIVPLGDWWFGEMGLVFMFAAIIIGKIAKLSQDDFIEIFMKGAQDLLSVSLIIGISRGITTVMSAGGMTATVLHWGEVTLSNLGPVAFANLSYLFYLPLSFLVPSTSGLATLSMPIFAPLAEFVGVSKDVIVTAFATSAGLMNLITPTSGILMGSLALSRIPYNKFMKFTLKLCVILSLIVMATLSISVIL